MKFNVQTDYTEVNKQATIISQGNPFLFHDMTPALESFQVKPGLFTALFDGSATTQNLTTHVYEFDRTSESLAIPDGKRYDEKGKRLTKDGYDMKYYGVPSFGVSINVMPADYVDRRKPGTMELMDEAYVLGRQTNKAEESWGLFKELAYAQLLTTDTNILRGGPFTEYNFYTDLVGSARPAKVDMKLDESVDHDALFRAEVDKITQNVMKAGMSMSRVVCLCGTTFFQQRSDIEKNVNFNREIRQSLDLASMPIPRDTFGDTGALPYYNFVGMLDGILYINCGNSIIGGTKLIADTDAYLMPLGLSGWITKAYAPSMHRDYVNKEASEMHMWTYTDEWRGVTSYWESNVLYALNRPTFITHLKNT